MKHKTLDLRELAKRDVEGIVDYYAIEAGDAVAFRFIDDLTAAYDLLLETHGAGSPRLGDITGFVGLRMWSLRKFPYAIFYYDIPDSIDVWRILHAQRDLEAALT